MRQYRVTYTVDTSGDPDCYIDPNDPVFKAKEGQLLGHIPNVDVYEVYPEDDGYDRPRNPYSPH